MQTNPSPSENLNQTRKNSSTLNGSFGMLSPSNTSGSIQNSRSYTGSPGLSNAQPGLQPSMQKNVQPHYGGNSPEGRIGQAQNPHDTNQVQSNFNMMKPPQHNAQFGGNIPYPTNSLRSPSPNSSIMSHEYNAPQKIPQRDSRTAQTTPNPTGMQRSSMHRSKQNLSRYPSSNSIRSPAKGNPAPSDM